MIKPPVELTTEGYFLVMYSTEINILPRIDFTVYTI